VIFILLVIFNLFKRIYKMNFNNRSSINCTTSTSKIFEHLMIFHKSCDQTASSTLHNHDPSQESLTMKLGLILNQIWTISKNSIYELSVRIVYLQTRKPAKLSSKRSVLTKNVSNYPSMSQKRRSKDCICCKSHLLYTFNIVNPGKERKALKVNL